MKTDQELSDIGQKIYWDFEIGEKRDAVETLRKLIADSKTGDWPARIACGFVASILTTIFYHVFHYP